MEFRKVINCKGAIIILYMHTLYIPRRSYYTRCLAEGGATMWTHPDLSSSLWKETPPYSC